MFPGEANATVELNVLAGICYVRIDCQNTRFGRSKIGLIVVGWVGSEGVTCRIPRGGRCQFDLYKHVGGVVLDRLEGGDRSAELHSDFGVFNSGVETSACPSNSVGGYENAGDASSQLTTVSQYCIIGNGHAGT